MPRLRRSLLLLLVICAGLKLVHGQTTDERVASLEQYSTVLAKELMMQQYKDEERIRSEGDSGLKLVRLRHDGPKPYYAATHASWSIAALHDHPDFERMCGMGEIVAVLNGVEFRTRHNDYTLVRPSTTSGAYHAVEDIPYPGVPPAVTKLPTVAEQVVEMQEWFRAWRDDNTTLRDYRPYFRPNLCYLEGAWTTDVDVIDEPFDSIRHQMDATTWEDMFQKARFMSLTGDKSLFENLAHLPSMILNVTNGVPVRAQWNYRILCHPIKGDIKLSDFELVDDLGQRMSGDKPWDRFKDSRAARFSLSPSSVVDFTSKVDEIMAQIPGKNNYGVYVTDSTLSRPKLDPNNDTPVNVGYYHRWFKLTEKGAMGENTIHRGFNDRNLFVAENTQPRVAPFPIKLCRFSNKNEANAECENIVKRVSYAIPLEIVFLTPLQSWNPYGIQYKGDYRTELGSTVNLGVRSGKITTSEAYDGINNRFYYLTPAMFFSGGSSADTNTDTADTTRNSVGVLDKNGVLRETAASGIRIYLPSIGDIEPLRIRYPIMPLHVEGSSIWKELEALRDLVLDMQGHLKYFYTSPGTAGPASSFTTASPAAKSTPIDIATTAVILTTSVAGNPPHYHTIGLNEKQYVRLVTYKYAYVNTTSSLAGGHIHELMVGYDEARSVFTIDWCDRTPMCEGGHKTDLEVQANYLSAVYTP